MQKNGLITIKGKMGNKKLSTDMARYIWSIIAKEPLLPMSWGVDLETVVCSEDALEFHVQGFLHTGNVRIVYIEGADIFQVLLYDEEGNLLKQIDDVYLDNLAETIDLNVEKYQGKYGVGFKMITTSPYSSNFNHITYFVKEAV
jgi:hypothetical protein